MVRRRKFSDEYKREAVRMVFERREEPEVEPICSPLWVADPTYVARFRTNENGRRLRSLLIAN